MEDDLHPSLASFTEADMEGVVDDKNDENSHLLLNDSFGMDNPPPAIDAVDADAQDARGVGDEEDEDDDEGYDEYDDDISTDGVLPPLLSGDCDDEEEMVDMNEDDGDHLGYSNNKRTGSGFLGYGAQGSGLRRSSTCTDNSGSSISDYDDEEMYEFFCPFSRHHEWMGRSIEALVFGHLAKTPLYSLIEDDDASDDASSAYAAFRRRSTASTFGGDLSHRRSSAGGSYAGTRRGSLSLTTGGQGGAMHGGTMANYYNRRRPMQPMDVDRSVDRRRSANAHAPSYRRRSSMACSGTGGAGGGQYGINNEPEAEQRAQAGPNVVLNLLAREMTGRSTTPFPNVVPVARALRAMGGDTLYAALDKPAGGISTEVGFLLASIEAGDWAETQMIISRMAPRLIGDPSAAMPQGTEGRQAAIDPNLPPSASPFYAGGGRVGLERDAFVKAGGVEAMIRIFREKTFVGQEMAKSFDARDLSKGLVATRLAPCWNEALASLRELIFAIPSLVESGAVLENGDFLPFLFTLLAHDSCFDSAAALIEEILSLMSHSPQGQAADDESTSDDGLTIPPLGRVAPVTTFYLGNVPDLYELWGGFNCRQLAHFCRILALLVFEPEDRQLLESPAVLKSLELLQLRRNRAVRAGRDSTVDMNQAILLGDPDLAMRMLKLLRVMNFAPSVRRSSPYHVMAHFPFIADTLVMLGLGEIDSWEEIDRLEALSRKLLNTGGTGENIGQERKTRRIVSELGTVADMLESLSNTLLRSNAPVTNQLGHIIHVISAAQQAGVVVGRPGTDGLNIARHRASATSLDDPGWLPQGGMNGGGSPDGDDSAATGLDMGNVTVDGTTIRGLASAAGVLTDQVLVRRLYSAESEDSDEAAVNDATVPRVFGISSLDGPPGRNSGSFEDRFFSEAQIFAPKDAANALQFNALLLGPYQVEVLFVMCTLLGGRRKMDAQSKLDQYNVIPILSDTFERLPWYTNQREQANADSSSSNSNDNTSDNARRISSGNGSDSADGEEQQPNGIHGPGCECTPESALCVQYLRLLHNFCDRDCDNYPGRHSLLSPSERALVFDTKDVEAYDASPPEQGLLSKIVEAFARESDESPYRFWLASCIESYLRGSSPGEQVFVARSGLLMHLVDDITSERLHCAGSLQTSFDLLGELCKGNNEVLTLLVSDLNEESFRKFMSVAAANLVDSNVFIRSLWLTLERLSAANRQVALHIDSTSSRGYQGTWKSPTGPSSRYYLTHSWWDTMGVPVGRDDNNDAEDETNDLGRPSDWFPTSEVVEAQGMHARNEMDFISSLSGLNESVGHFGWVFSPVGESLSAATFEPNTTERLSWFLAANQARLLRDLLGVVDLRNINHENICCLNTAVVIAIFAHRRHQLAALLRELSLMNDEERESKRRAITPSSNDDLIDRAFVNAMRYLDLDEETPSYSRRASLRRDSMSSSQQIGDRTDVMRNFREVLWFWFEYYTHRGRDRLSLEFSSHLRFQEWMQVVYRLVADDGSPTSLVTIPVRLPRSPYQSAARITDNNPLRPF